ncbi:MULTISPECIES: PAS domain S-box protein [unclassified Pseudomonas]|uniref:PAS domain-containing hybrid sensor histidine kinase/response regulator n=1 Tax=unclassified Pseudomonas TaxID=196821 RepID=UPI000C87D57A|nr:MULTISPECIES: PAS domain S-box protein [unclassified Pseudomonas]PMU12443.1 hybrid sensor histidine kinase/response regulator [Pseudomonas sp. FW305-20]PMU22426.1 hybrid sensor histidine kinase/response regulator [Pseudomonas sp. FW305-122]PMU36803.1 hybrid sensor histidine kinase/response regulator [Pseudomonas sp. FW305-47B]PMX61528.1 hybrid sensor histidine kinase/response regulator [Pseudomonas sp. FW305-60]PMX64969.1 hybrid sensor histidine kinase/response regulator [Pseudomonas sp. FW
MNATPTGSDAQALIARLDWRLSPLGAASTWPQSLRTAVDIVIHSPMPMLLLWGPQLTQIYNDGFALLSGSKHPHAFGQPTHLVWPELKDFTDPIYSAVLQGQVRTYSEQRFTLQRNGQDSDFWLDLTYSPIRDESAQVAGILVTAIETNERRRIALELEQRSAASLKAQHETEERLQLALAATDAVGTWDWDINEDRFIADAHFAQLHGIDPLLANQLPISAYLQGVHPQDRAMVARSIKHSITHGTEYAEEYRLLQADGQLRWVFARGRCYKDHHGRPIRFLGAALDLTERKHTEQALRQSQTELQLIINAMPILISYVDSEERFRLNNAAYLDWYGLTPQELFGKTIREVLGEEAYSLRAEHIAQALSGKPCCFSLSTSHRDGSIRHALMNYLPRHGADGAVNGFYIFVIDETERKQTEEALRNLNETLEERVAARTQQLAQANQRLQNEMFERERAEEALRHAQKMEALGQLTGGIAHDFNNMLTGIIGSLDLMQRYIADGRAAEVGRFSEAAVSSANRAAALTHRLLAFSRRQSLDRRPLNANDLIHSLEDLLSRTTGDHIELKLQLADDVWPVSTDVSQLENGLLNLVINARDAMPDGGELRIETANVYLDSSDINTLEPVKAGDYLMIAVSDNGTGMTPSVLAKAFDPFFTTKPIGQGTGLGLSMIYGFAQQSGGHVSLFSLPGQGTSVRLYLPRLHNAEPENVLMPVTSEAPAAIAGETVVLVEDDPAVRMLVLDLLKELGYHAHEAEDAKTALPLLESDLRIDLLVTDVGLPGMNGRQLAEIARQHRPALKVLFMTGYAEKAAERQGFLEEGMDMVAKPFSIDLMANKIRAMIGQPD